PKVGCRVPPLILQQPLMGQSVEGDHTAGRHTQDRLGGTVRQVAPGHVIQGRWYVEIPRIFSLLHSSGSRSKLLQNNEGFPGVGVNGCGQREQHKRQAAGESVAAKRHGKSSMNGSIGPEQSPCSLASTLAGAWSGQC